MKETPAERFSRTALRTSSVPSAKVRWPRALTFPTVGLGFPGNLPALIFVEGLLSRTRHPSENCRDAEAQQYFNERIHRHGFSFLTCSFSYCAGRLSFVSSGRGDKNIRSIFFSPMFRRTTKSTLYPSKAPDKQSAFAQMW